MKKSLWVRLVIMFLVTLTLSSCIWAVEDEGRGGGGGGHFEEHHDHH
jgi:hypothetical protein